MPLRSFGKLGKTRKNNAVITQLKWVLHRLFAGYKNAKKVRNVIVTLDSIELFALS